MKVSGLQYVQNYGPTTGDKIRLGDTNLIIEVEKDYTVYGEECKFGGGKTLREGMGQSSTVTSANGALDLVITNCVVLDYTGIYKCDIGLKDGYIAGLGKAGNPDIMDGVDPKMVVGCSTEALAGEGLIVTAGGTDLHIHWICPQQIETALLSGITTMGGGGTGPADGTNATTCTPGPFYIKEMLKSFEDMPMNIVLYGKGNGAIYQDIAEQVEAGASGLKLHEDWGTTPAAIDMCLNVCDDYDVMCAIHTDTLNEAGCVEDTMTAINGRVMHTFHSEGAGGGHAPDIISVSGFPNIIPSSTNPTMPHTLNTIDEHLDMLMVCHHLDNRIPEDVAFADSRIRPETIKAEDVLHDMGIFSMMSSDSQAMGRPAEVITRTWQCAHKMKEQRGKLPEDAADNDNFRAKRYVAKYTINPAIACGTAYILGSVEVGKFADLVLWDPKFFGIKPKMVIKGGVITASEMGDANASIPTVEPIILKYMFGAYGQAVHDTCITFVSQASLDNGKVASYNLKKRIMPVKGTRTIGKKDMKFNDVCADVKVDPETYVVTVNGKQATCEIATSLPLTQLYNLF